MDGGMDDPGTGRGQAGTPVPEPFFFPLATFSWPPATFLAGAPRRPARARPQDHPSIHPIIHLAFQAYSSRSLSAFLATDYQ